MQHKKGQAALEFLSTYGFAFLIILVMIGALSYFGILSPSRLIPARCSFSPEFQCSETQIIGGANPVLNIVLVSQIGDQITFNGTTYALSQYGVGTCPAPGVISGGSKFTLACTFTGVAFPGRGEKVKATYDGNYSVAGKSFPVAIHGEILQTVS